MKVHITHHCGSAIRRTSAGRARKGSAGVSGRCGANEHGARTYLIASCVRRQRGAARAEPLDSSAHPVPMARKRLRSTFSDWMPFPYETSPGWIGDREAPPESYNLYPNNPLLFRAKKA